jgi:hypothetical protein
MPAKKTFVVRDQFPATTRDVQALLREYESMDSELGRWLRHHGRRLLNRAAARVGGRAAVGGLHPSVWRTLVVIWCTSPDTRDRFSDEARNGLISAIESMDDVTAGSLIKGLLDRSTDDPTASDAAA